MAKPVPSERRATASPPEHQRAIIIALVRAGLKPVRTLPVQMPCHAKPGAALERNLWPLRL